MWIVWERAGDMFLNWTKVVAGERWINLGTWETRVLTGLETLRPPGPSHVGIWEVRVRGSLKSHLWAQFRAAMPNQPPRPPPHTHTHILKENS